MMTPESFALLKKKVKDKIVDSSSDKRIKKLSTFFVKDASDLAIEQPFIEIRILVPTTIKKMKKFRSIQYWITNKVKNRKINTRNALNDLFDKKFEGYLLLEKRRQSLDVSWIQSFNLTRITKKFNEIDVKITQDYQEILKAWFGPNFMKSHVPIFEYKYTSPLVKKKVVL